MNLCCAKLVYSTYINLIGNNLILTSWINYYSLSVIIPTFNEEDIIAETIAGIRKHDQINIINEIIVADGGSTDNTCALAAAAGAIVIKSPARGRSVQMNKGAAVATGNILYFLHADTIPPEYFSTYIVNALQKDNAGGGCFLLSFDLDHWFLKASAWLTRFNVDAIRFGDQSIFVTKNLFKKTGGFDELFIVLEDQHFVKRLKKLCRFIIIKKPVKTSARKYRENGIYQTQLIYFIIYCMYKLNFSQETLVNTYCKLIRKNKLK